MDFQFQDIALNLYQLTSHKFWINPLQWDPYKHNIIVTRWSYQLMPWYCIFFFSVVLYGMVGCGYPVIRHIRNYDDPVSAPICIVLCLFFVIFVYCATLNIYLLAKGRMLSTVGMKLRENHIKYKGKQVVVQIICHEIYFLILCNRMKFAQIYRGSRGEVRRKE